MFYKSQVSVAAIATLASCPFGQLAKVLYKNSSLYSLDKKYKCDIISNISPSYVVATSTFEHRLRGELSPSCHLGELSVRTTRQSAI